MLQTTLGRLPACLPPPTRPPARPATQVHLSDGTKWTSAQVTSHGSAAYLGCWVALQTAAPQLMLRVHDHSAASLTNCGSGRVSAEGTLHLAGIITAETTAAVGARAGAGEGAAPGGELEARGLDDGDGSSVAAATPPPPQSAWRHVSLELRQGHGRVVVARHVKQALQGVADGGDAAEEQVRRAVHTLQGRHGTPAATAATAGWEAGAEQGQEQPQEHEEQQLDLEAGAPAASVAAAAETVAEGQRARGAERPTSSSSRNLISDTLVLRLSYRPLVPPASSLPPQRATAAAAADASRPRLGTAASFIRLLSLRTSSLLRWGTAADLQQLQAAPSADLAAPAASRSLAAAAAAEAVAEAAMEAQQGHVGRAVDEPQGRHRWRPLTGAVEAGPPLELALDPPLPRHLHSYGHGGKHVCVCLPVPGCFWWSVCARIWLMKAWLSPPPPTLRIPHACLPTHTSNLSPTLLPTPSPARPPPAAFMGAALSMLCERQWQGILRREDPEGFREVQR